jgi:hypothetical protein
VYIYYKRSEVQKSRGKGIRKRYARSPRHQEICITEPPSIIPPRPENKMPVFISRLINDIYTLERIKCVFLHM